MSPSGYAQVVEERSIIGGLLASYVYGASLDPISITRPGEAIGLYLADGHSGVRQVLAAVVGAVLAAYRYDAFGNKVADAGTFVNAVGYRGERFDATLGEYYLRARFYDPRMGRFTGMDTYANNRLKPDTINRYAYVSHNPIELLDPTGLTWEFNAEDGMAAHVLFSAYSLLVGKTPTLNFPVGAVSLAVLGTNIFGADVVAASQQPDAIDFLGRDYFELKPITHKTKPALRGEDVRQLARYSLTLGIHGFMGGDQDQYFPLAFLRADGLLRMPIGMIRGTDGKSYVLMIESAPITDGSLRGLIYYYTRKLPDNFEPAYAPVPILPFGDLATRMVDSDVRVFDEETQDILSERFYEIDGPRSYLPELVGGAVSLGVAAVAFSYRIELRNFMSYMVTALAFGL